MIKRMYKEYTIDLTKPQEPQIEKIIRDFGPLGVSPGYAAAYLGISRQAVDKACKKGALRACKILDKRSKHSIAKLGGIYIDSASLDAYKELRDLNGGRVPFGAIAI